MISSILAQVGERIAPLSRAAILVVTARLLHAPAAARQAFCGLLSMTVDAVAAALGCIGPE